MARLATTSIVHFVATIGLLVSILFVNSAFVCSGCSLKKPNKCFNEMEDLVKDISKVANTGNSRSSSSIKTLKSVGKNLNTAGKTATSNSKLVVSRTSDLNKVVNKVSSASKKVVNDIGDDLYDAAIDLKDDLIDAGELLLWLIELYGHLVLDAFELPDDSEMEEFADILETCMNEMIGSTAALDLVNDLLDEIESQTGIDFLSQIMKLVAVQALPAKPVLEFFCTNFGDILSDGFGFISSIDFDEILNDSEDRRLRRRLSATDCDSDNICNATDVDYTSPGKIKKFLPQAHLNDKEEYTDASTASVMKEFLFAFQIFGKIVEMTCDGLSDCNDPFGLSGCAFSTVCAGINAVFDTGLGSMLETFLDIGDIHDGIVLTDEMSANVVNIDIMVDNQHALSDVIDSTQTAIIDDFLGGRVSHLTTNFSTMAKNANETVRNKILQFNDTLDIIDSRLDVIESLVDEIFVAITLAPSNLPTTEPTFRPTEIPTEGTDGMYTEIIYSIVMLVFLSNLCFLQNNITKLAPTKTPTRSPTNDPTPLPTKSPSDNPTTSPTVPTSPPTRSPSHVPTDGPSKSPTSDPTKSPSKDPTDSSTNRPTVSASPTNEASPSPTEVPPDTGNTSVTLTPQSSSSSIANVSLYIAEFNYIAGGVWHCENPWFTDFCVYLRIFNSGCSGKETINIVLYGAATATSTLDDPDLYSIFSIVNSERSTEWATFFSDWDGACQPNEFNEIGGIWGIPANGSNSLLSTKHTIFDLLDDSRNDYDSVQTNLAGANIFGWDLLTSERVGFSTSPLYYTIVNDKIGRKSSIEMYSSTITRGKVEYDTIFDTDSRNDWIIPFMADEDVIELYQFDVSVSCEEEASGQREYGFTALSPPLTLKANAMTRANFSIQFISNCTYVDNNNYCEENIGSLTEKFIFSPQLNVISNNSDATSISINFEDIDIGEINFVQIRIEDAILEESNSWMIESFSFLAGFDENNNSEEIWRDCSLNWMQYYNLDSECTDNGGSELLTINVSENSTVCKNRGSTRSSIPGNEIGVSTNRSERNYTLEMRTSDLNSACDSNVPLNIRFIHNCSFIDNDGELQTFCNKNDTMIATQLYTINTAGVGSSVTISFIDTQIGAVNYLYIEYTDDSSDDGYCFDYLKILINDETNEWIECDFEKLMGFLLLDGNCHDAVSRLYKSLTLDLLSENTPCNVL